tara:strand:+ start:266 stop:454 length:189 start_codon:yes stop_codon:yes gene_type:complete
MTVLPAPVMDEAEGAGEVGDSNGGASERATAHSARCGCCSQLTAGEAKPAALMAMCAGRRAL